MKKFNKTRSKSRKIRHIRFKNKHKKFSFSIPRLIITKTNANVIAQIFDDTKGTTLVSSSSLQLKLKSNNIEACKKIGEDIAKKALAKKIKKICFDCGGNKYHGKIEALANAARKAGLQF